MTKRKKVDGGRPAHKIVRMKGSPGIGLNTPWVRLDVKGKLK